MSCGVQSSRKRCLQTCEVLVTIRDGNQVVRGSHRENEAIGPEIRRHKGRRVGHLHTHDTHAENIANRSRQTEQEVGGGVCALRTRIRPTRIGIHVDVLTKAGVHVNETTLDIGILVDAQLGLVNLTRHPLLCDLSFFPLDLRVRHEPLVGQLEVQNTAKERRRTSIQDDRTLLVVFHQGLQEANEQQRTSFVILLSVIGPYTTRALIGPPTDALTIRFGVSRARHANLSDKLCGLCEIHQSNLAILPLVKRLFQNIGVDFFHGFPQLGLIFILEIARQHIDQLIQNFRFLGDLSGFLRIVRIGKSTDQVLFATLTDCGQHFIHGMLSGDFFWTHRCPKS